MELSRFTPAYIADKKLRINWFEVELNPGLKERMSVRHYAWYEYIYDTVVKVERAMKDMNQFYNKPRGIKRRGDQRGNHHSQQSYKRSEENSPNNPYPNNWHHPGTRLGIACNACGKPGHYARECHTVKHYFHCRSPQHQVRGSPLPPPTNERRPGGPQHQQNMQPRSSQG